MKKLKLDDAYLGIEIEIENAASIVGTRTFYWDVKTDGSLREGGAELVFIQPLKGKDVINAIEEAYSKLLNKKMKCSPRTAIHAHLDIRFMNLDEIRTLCLLYALTEEPLFKWIGAYRESNNFCLPWYEADGDISKISSVFSKKGSTALKTGARRLHRYSALNLNAISKFGSVEFRHLQTTLDKNRVYTWVNMILCLKKAATQLHRMDSLGLLDLFSKMGNGKFMEMVYEEYAQQLDASIINLGLMTAHDLIATVGAKKQSTFYAHLLKKGEPLGIAKFRRKHKDITV